MTRHLWVVRKKEGTLWVKWINTYVIKKQWFWTMKIPGSAPWTVRKIEIKTKTGL